VANHDVLALQSKVIAGNVSHDNGSDVGPIAQHSIASGIVTFEDAGGSAIAIGAASNLSSAIGYLAANITVPGTTVAFRADSDNNGSIDSLYVWQDSGTLSLAGGFVVTDMALRIGYDSTNIGAGYLNNVILGTTEGANVLQLLDGFAPEPIVTGITVGDGFQMNFAENVYAPAGTAMTLQVNGTGTVFSPTSFDGDGTSNLTVHFSGANMLATDWAILTYAGSNGTNALSDGAGGTGNLLSTGGGTDTFVEGGGGNNSIDLSALSAGYDINARAGDDTITGSSGADSLNGGIGADTLNGGGGVDEFSFAQGDSPAVTALNLGGNSVLDDGDTFSFAGGLDRVNGLASGEQLFLNARFGDATGQNGPGKMGATPTNGLAADQGFFLVQGNYAGSDFAVNSSGADTLLVYDGDSSAAIAQTGVLLSGVIPSQIQVFTGSNTITIL